MLTNFTLLTSEQKTIWKKDLWRNARNMSFVNTFMGNGPMSLVSHITELKKTEKGARAVITLLADLVGDGIAGDRTLEGNEEAMATYDQVIRIDQLRNASRHEGRMADQKSIVEFRNNSRDNLAYWLADRMDQLAFLTLGGVSYARKNNGALRVGSDFPSLEFAADVTPPSNARRMNWNATTETLTANGSTTAVTATDYPTWHMFVQLKAYAKDRYMRGVGGVGGEEMFHAFMTPQAMARLKQDEDYKMNLRHAQERGDKNKLFTGSTVKIDGIMLHEFRHVPNVSGATSGVDKYGAGFNLNGSQVLFCGAQALGMADIGDMEWDEKEFDYGNSQAIAVGKIMGFLKPRFGNIYENGSVEDFGVISTYTAY